MATQVKALNFVDFINAITKNHALGKELQKNFETMDAAELVNWFKSKGYTISEGECQSILNTKEALLEISSPIRAENY